MPKREVPDRESDKRPLKRHKPEPGPRPLKLDIYSCRGFLCPDNCSHSPTSGHRSRYMLEDNSHHWQGSPPEKIFLKKRQPLSKILTPTIALYLTSLELSMVCFRFLPANISGLVNLQHLRIGPAPHLQCLPEALAELKNLWCLELVDCPSLQVMPAAFEEMASLKRVLLAYCHMQRLPRMPRQLETLLVDHCSCEYMPPNLASLKELRTFILDFCDKLAVLPDSLGELASLSKLGLRDCRNLVQIPPTVGRLSKLETLLCGERKLVYAFADCVSLLYTDLSVTPSFVHRNFLLRHQ